MTLAAIEFTAWQKATEAGAVAKATEVLAANFGKK